MSRSSNILHTELVWIGDKCFRKICSPSSGEKGEETLEDDLYPSERIKTYDDADLDDVVVTHMDDCFVATMIVPTCLVQALFRGKPKPILKIGNDTKSQINVPSDRANQDSSELIMKAQDGKSVREAHRRVGLIIEAARFQMDFTHFVSLPIIADSLKKSFLRFKDDVLKHCRNCYGLSSNLFQNPDKLHLTVATLILLDKKEREDAAAALQSCKQNISDILRGDPLLASVKGIEIMNDDPSQVDVLYAKIRELEDKNSVQRIANVILSALNKTGSTKDRRDSVKLHITLINSKFTEQGRKREPFDARPILENYADYDFGTIEISEIHISIRHTVGNAGYYYSSSILSLKTE